VEAALYARTGVPEVWTAAFPICTCRWTTFSGRRARRTAKRRSPASVIRSCTDATALDEGSAVEGSIAGYGHVTDSRQTRAFDSGPGVCKDSSTVVRPDLKEARMFFELRQYHVRPGQREKWVKCMEEEIIPFQVKMGMVILGSFVGEEDESVYVWIRRFENEQERKRLYDLVYQSDYWKNEIAPKVPTLIDREQIKVTRLMATPHSVIQ
jgi:hypothetical protein